MTYATTTAASATIAPAKTRMSRRDDTEGHLAIVCDTSHPARPSTSKLPHAAVFDVVKMPPDAIDDFLSLGPVQVLPELFQGEVDDVVVMELFGRQLATEFKPDAVKEMDFLRREVWRMRAQIEDMFLAAREIDAQGQLRFGIR